MDKFFKKDKRCNGQLYKDVRHTALSYYETRPV